MESLPTPTQLIPARDLPALLGRPRMSYASIWRLITKGKNGTKLEALKIGASWYVTMPALVEFGRACAAAQVEKYAGAAAVPAAAPKSRTAKRREADINDAKAFLRAQGVM